MSIYHGKKMVAGLYKSGESSPIDTSDFQLKSSMDTSTAGISYSDDRYPSSRTVSSLIQDFDDKVQDLDDKVDDLSESIGDNMTPLIDWDYYNYTSCYVNAPVIYSGGSTTAGSILYTTGSANYLRWKYDVNSNTVDTDSPIYSDGRNARFALPLKEPYTNFREIMIVFNTGNSYAYEAPVNNSQGSNQCPQVLTISTAALYHMLAKMTGGVSQMHVARLGTYTPYDSAATNSPFSLRFLTYAGYEYDSSKTYGYAASKYAKSSDTLLIDGSMTESENVDRKCSHRFYEVYGIGRKN